MDEQLQQALAAIDPAALNYEEWCQVGMALKHEGVPCHIWAEWSASDASRYHDGECERKWQGFDDDGDIVTAGTIFHLAKQFGFAPRRVMEDKPIGWNDVIPAENGRIIDVNWLEGNRKVEEPSDKDWNPNQDLATYLEALFSPDEIVSYCTQSHLHEKDGAKKYVPSFSGNYKTCAELVHTLKTMTDDIAWAVGDYNKEAGGWIRFNPFKEAGTVKATDANVADFRYTLIESDSIPVNQQKEIIEKLNLPVAALVASGNKSLHAIVRIDAGNDSKEYRKRVNALYDVCEKNGLALDKQNRNASRLSRMPGLWRKGKKQFLIGTNLGAKDYAAWHAWYEEQNDDLPDFENLASFDWDNLPPLAPELIEGILRKGHKMLISGPSKAGKSFLLIELTIALANGARWLRPMCAKGPVVYVNFELDRASCLNRFKVVYEAMGMDKANLKDIDIWNLRGKTLDLKNLAPKLIRRAVKEKPSAIILDPIYKVITGDENSAADMAAFCNQFDKIATEVGCSVIYCHHHSKGAQGGKKAMDRASGSGVFARDPDALLDIIELPLKHEQRTHVKNKLVCKAIAGYLDEHLFLPVGDRGLMTKFVWRDDIGLDDIQSEYQMTNYAKDHLTNEQLADLQKCIAEADDRADHVTAWRISSTLREFATPPDMDMWFDYPLHYADASGLLKDIRPDVEVNGRTLHQKDKSDGSAKAEKQKEERQAIIDAYTLIAAEKEPDKDGVVRVTVADAMERSEDFFDKELSKKSIYRKFRKYGDFTIDNSVILPAEKPEESGDDDVDE